MLGRYGNPDREKSTMKIRSKIAGTLVMGAVATGLSVTSGAVAHAATPSLCAIQTSGGFYLEATFGGGRTTDAIVTDQRGIGAFSKFSFVPTHDAFGHVGIRTNNGNYVTALNGGGLTTAVTRDVLHTNATQLQDWEKFTVSSQTDGAGHSDGTVAIRTFDGHYLTALGAGGQHNGAFNTNATRVGSWEKFRLFCGI
jgi:hypothetical protein